MCGITGFISTSRTLSDKVLLVMRDSLVHRGPDDAGIKQMEMTSSGRAVFAGLAHRRLAIIDLSEAGRQPMSNEDGTIWITYNGECYNYQELLVELTNKGHVFTSETDTEVLIHGYEEWGLPGLLERINGMFAFALVDSQAGALFLARDRLGKKPLYYTQLSDGTLIFASEIKALTAGGFVDAQRIDDAAIIQFWTYGYSTGGQTMYRDIHRLLPGHYGQWNGGRFTVTEYWDISFGKGEYRGRTIDDLADELEELLLDSIRLRLIADVPVGVFLSGGIDSSLIAALTAKICQQDIRSFSIGFSTKKFDESHHAKRVSDHLGIDNVRLMVDEDMRPYFQRVALHFDELFGDSSAIASYFVAKLAREYVTVALTGDAGDELFAGYDAYAKALSLWGNAGQRRLFRRRFSLLQQIINVLQLSCVAKNERLSALERIMPLTSLKKILSPQIFAEEPLFWAYRSREQWYSRVAGADLLSQLQYMNVKTYLPDDILVKVDRMSMAHALECRSPLLDHRIVEFAGKLDYDQKMSPDGKGKYILRRLLRRYVPDHLIDRPKMGFSIPWSEWCYDGPMGQEIAAKWQNMSSPWFRNEAASFLFPKKRMGWPARQWNAFCTVEYFADLDSPYKAQSLYR